MAKKVIYYKYREVNNNLLKMLCNDEIYFADPSKFNDPMENLYTIECDSSIDELAELYKELKYPRIYKESINAIKAIHSGIDKAEIQNHLTRISIQTINSDLERCWEQSIHPDYEYSQSPEHESSRRELFRRELFYAIKNELKNHYNRGVFCLATTYESHLLWSHYGAHHEGICIGYSTDRDPEPDLEKVIYGDMDKIQTSVLIDAFVEKNVDAKKFVDREILLRKSRAWEYEKEWRLIGNKGLQDSPLLLEEIIFGWKCHLAVEHTIVKALEDRSKKVQMYKMARVSESYRLERELYFHNDGENNYPKVSWSGKELFGKAFGNIDDIKKQLPAGAERYVSDDDND